MKLADAINRAAQQLALITPNTAKKDAELLVHHALTLHPSARADDNNETLDEHEIDVIQQMIDRRMRRESMARILGVRTFWGLPFGLNDATLDPREDSETAIRAVLKHLRKRRWKEISKLRASPPSPLKILDLGTGTGCLLLSLLHEIPHAVGVGVDLSARAVDQAIVNAKSLQLDTRASFVLSNWLDKVEGEFDVIVSNPPYIKSSDIGSLMRTVREYDPRLALDGGKQGIDAYLSTIPRLAAHMKHGGIVVLEIGYDQVSMVVGLLKQNMFENLRVHRDNNEKERCVSGVWKG